MSSIFNRFKSVFRRTKKSTLTPKKDEKDEIIEKVKQWWNEQEKKDKTTAGILLEPSTIIDGYTFILCPLTGHQAFICASKNGRNIDLFSIGYDVMSTEVNEHVKKALDTLVEKKGGKAKAKAKTRKNRVKK